MGGCFQVRCDDQEMKYDIKLQNDWVPCLPGNKIYSPITVDCPAWEDICPFILDDCEHGVPDNGMCVCEPGYLGSQCNVIDNGDNRQNYPLKKNLANKIFGYLARCEEDFGIWTLQNQKFGSKWDENAEFHSAKI